MRGGEGVVVRGTYSSVVRVWYIQFGVYIVRGTVGGW